MKPVWRRAHDRLRLCRALLPGGIACLAVAAPAAGVVAAAPGAEPVPAAMTGVWGHDGNCGNPLQRLTVTADSIALGPAPPRPAGAAPDTAPLAAAAVWRDGGRGRFRFDPARQVLLFDPQDGGAVRTYQRCRTRLTH